MTAPRIPTATYRLQLRPGFDLDAAAAIVGYLEELGISDVYLSPIFAATPGSEHGYDVVDPTRISDELGGEPAFRRLSQARASRGLGLLLDIVPNHMATAAPENVWWTDVLAHGEHSEWAQLFDIDWAPARDSLKGRVAVPVLARPIDEAIEAGDISLERASVERGDRATSPLVIVCAGHRLPVEGTLEDIEAWANAVDRGELGADDLRAALDSQRYMLTFWRRARTHLNYRRFFTITSMVGVRADEPEVFDITHKLVVGLCRAGEVTGLRVDHPDGLSDPEAYLRRLRQETGAPWIVVEKILEHGERLPATWDADGTTGYDFGAEALGILVDSSGERLLNQLYTEITSLDCDFLALVRRCKHQVMASGLAPEIERLQNLVEVAATELDLGEGPSPFMLSQALVETLASFPVYRTYLRPGDRGADEADVRAIDGALGAALRERGDLGEALAILRRLLLDSQTPAARELVARFQQTCAPVMAKGVEDTAFYLFNRFAALNEVGADPSVFSAAPGRFSCFLSRATGPLARHHERLLDPRHQAKRRCEGAACRSL